jgi:hypothetical protein
MKDIYEVEFDICEFFIQSKDISKLQSPIRIEPFQSTTKINIVDGCLVRTEIDIIDSFLFLIKIKRIIRIKKKGILQLN